MRLHFESEFSGAELKNTTFELCNLKGCKFRYTFLNHTKFNSNLLDSADFSFANFKNSCFTNNSYYSIIIDDDNRNRLKLDEAFGVNIQEVRHGWFGMFIYNKNETFYLDASDYLGHDAPKMFLRALIEIASTESIIDDRYIGWHDEPGANIIRIYSKDNFIGLQIFGSSKPSYELKNSDDFLKEQIEELYIDLIVQREVFIKEMLDAFARIVEKIGIQSYEDNWFNFPINEIKDLKRIT